jgi:hypothetical protein
VSSAGLQMRGRTSRRWPPAPSGPQLTRPLEPHSHAPLPAAAPLTAALLRPCQPLTDVPPRPTAASLLARRVIIASAKSHGSRYLKLNQPVPQAAPTPATRSLGLSSRLRQLRRASAMADAPLALGLARAHQARAF